MKSVNTLIMFFGVIIFSIAQQSDFNLVQLSNVQYPERGSDVWGYVDDNGTEYAIMGTSEATAVLSLEDPENPIERAYIPGVSSIWRDIKTWEHYAYVIADVGEDGLLIINMEKAPDTITHTFLNVPFTYNGTPDVIRKCHNLYIDEKGILFLSGCNTGSNGVMMFDLNNDPENPEFLGAESAAYSHDNVSRGDTLWTSDLSQGFSVWDVSDKANPIELARQNTSSNFTHNAWMSDDNKYLFTTDERANAYLDAYDVSDLNNIQFLDNFRPKSTENQGVIPHNTHFINGFLVTSWYTDGVKIVDGNKPDNLVEVGSFDSYIGPHGGFNGCWGAYPYLPSGLILINDIQTGLYVLDATYQRACYLEGMVTDAATGDPIPNVSVEIQSSFFNSELTDFTGNYKTGQAESGMFDVVFSHPEYIDQTIEVELVNGEVEILNVELFSRPFFTATGLVIDAVSKDPVPNAQVLISNDFDSYNSQANASGLFNVAIYNDMPDTTYEIVTGSWGYNHDVITDITLDQNIQVTIELEKGYQDDFLFDLGWTESGTAPRGKWERGDPNGTTVRGEIANPAGDVESDIGEQCFVTGNAAGGGAGDDDVDDGFTLLTSPVIDLTTYVEPYMSYRTWFYNGSRPDPNDSLVVAINNGQEEVILEVVRQSRSFWRDSSIYQIADYIDLTDSMTISVQVSDDQASGHISEGGFDEFRIWDKFSTDISDESVNHWRVYPTPVHNRLIIESEKEGNQVVHIINTNGQLMTHLEITQGLNEISVIQWPEGIYFIRLTDIETGDQSTLPIIRQ
ncbi:MAG: choice-of-anchor B family protein [Saprospiraceae bacterium]|nr:choice-of-anchor B family protein [Saprospiraceae bacterium]